METSAPCANTGQTVFLEPGSISWPRRSVIFVANAAWWMLLAALPLLASLTYLNIWSLGVSTCDESYFHYAGSGLTILILLVFGVPLAYVVEGMALFLGRGRSRPLRFSLVVTLLLLVIALGLALTLKTESSAACPAGVPPWWPTWLS